MSYSVNHDITTQLFIDEEVLSINRIEACRHGRVKVSAQDLLTTMNGTLSPYNRRLLEDSLGEYHSIQSRLTPD
ncbi:hypothetical protein [Pseudogracilibacillus sp. SO30301A]|uniref:hypothetical protein n=1 Tax=Pseudogracilibacillus sp. SO30301A TaxID=3098291 RepID=UPI00300E12EF